MRRFSLLANKMGSDWIGTTTAAALNLKWTKGKIVKVLLAPKLSPRLSSVRTACGASMKLALAKLRPGYFRGRVV